MAAILAFCAVFAVLYFFVWKIYFTPGIQKSDDNALYFIGVTAFSSFIYIICSALYVGHKTDMGCFSAWSDMIFKGGIANFYTSDAFHDYPPGYMYVLYVIGAIKSLFGISGTAPVLLKLPSLICNIGTGYIVYISAKKHFGAKISAVLSGAYLLNPAVITNGALWGQVDSVYTFTVVLMIYLLSHKKMISSYFVFAICIFIKPQALIFTPVLILAIVENVFLNDFSSKRTIKNLLLGLCAILMLFVLALPFGINNVIYQYTQTLAQYPYFTINAFNLWGMLGKNWSPISPAASATGYVLLALITVYSAYVFLKSKNVSKYCFTGALLSFLTYMLSVKMHDRYAFPALALMLMAFATGRSRRSYVLFTLLTLSQFFNTAWVLFIYEQDINVYFQSPVIPFASALNIALAVLLTVYAQKDYISNEIKETHFKKADNIKTNIVRPFAFQKSETLSKLTRFDYIAMAAVTLIYGAVALYNLGDMHAPETETLINKTPVTVDFGEDVEIDKIAFFLGSYNLDSTRTLKLAYKTESGNVTEEVIDEGSVFYWNEIDAAQTARYIELSSDSTVSIKELAINGGAVKPVNSSDITISKMFDEQQYIPDRPSFRNGTYFDEIYHARTAYEFIHHLDIYEWTHPPLGKLIISLGIMLFGMCPFGWRAAGTVVGILMVPIIYIFAKRMFKHSWLALITCVLFTFDFMHFAQTRIATIDVYVTFFIMLMYYFMYRYSQMSFYDTPLSKTLAPLAFSGIFMGLGIASKWTGVYAGAGLAVIFFAVLARRYREYRYALQNPHGTTDGISHDAVTASFKPYMIKTIAWCCVFFIAVPVIIYFCAYIPYMMTPSGNGLKTIFENAESMYTYHAKTVLGSEHPYSSRWYQWPVMYRPIWFYSGKISSELKEGISSFGNPAVWWIGIPAFIYLIYHTAVHRDRKSAFLAVAYLAQYLPWVPISRLTFIYHYFPCVPFVTLMIGYCIYTIYNDAQTVPAKKRVICGSCAYAAIAVILFIMFYPVLSGAPCSVKYADTFLKWFDSWVLL